VAKRLTDISIRNLRPGPARREIPDGNGLYIVVQPSGRKSFAVRYRFSGIPKKLTLPAGLTLAAARRLAADAVYQAAQGSDPVAAKKTAKVETAESTANTVAAVCAAYMQREGGKLRTADQRERIFRRLIYPVIGGRQLDSIKRSELVQMLDRIEDRSGARMADVTLAVLRRVFTWHALRSDEFRSPIVRGMGRQVAVEHRRSRVLDDRELRAVWTAAGAASGPFGTLVRFLLLTSGRRNEAARMRWDEIDAEGIWTLPATRSKTKSEIIRPLSKAALALLDGHLRTLDCDFVFTSNGSTAIASFSGPKEKLDAASGVTGWRIHDLRRTARSLLSRAGINADVAERCLGHALPGIRATYDRHHYIDEMRYAFETLAAQIELIINPPRGDVVPLRQRPGRA
jgi:integrase